MANTALAEKLKLKAGARAALIGSPQGYLEELGRLPAGTELLEQLDGTFDWVQVFVRDQSELASVFPAVRAALKPGSLLWLTFPKGSSKIQTDLTRDKGWKALAGADLKWINLISVNETWSAFSLRPFKPGEKRQLFR